MHQMHNPPAPEILEPLSPKEVGYVMHPYEIMVILDPEVEERTVQPTLERFLSVITNGGGSVESLDIWGRRRLSYEIQKKSEGIYAVANFTADPATTHELERQLRLNEWIMRTKVLRADEAVARIASQAVDAAEAAQRAEAVVE
jgi:small subunit ribosomal protein S6